MGLAGRVRIETELAWSYSIPELLKAYRAVLPRPMEAKRAITSDAQFELKHEPSTSSLNATTADEPAGPA